MRVNKRDEMSNPCRSTEHGHGFTRPTKETVISCLPSPPIRQNRERKEIRGRRSKCLGQRKSKCDGNDKRWEEEPLNERSVPAVELQGEAGREGRGRFAGPLLLQAGLGGCGEEVGSGPDTPAWRLAPLSTLLISRVLHGHARKKRQDCINNDVSQASA